MQGVLEDALQRVCGEPVAVTGAGRTDRGVHARRQVVHADVPAGWRFLADLSRARQVLDRLCGEAITIWRVRRVPATFDARFSARERRYRYRLCDAEAMDPLWRRTTWHVARPVDEAAMGRAGQVLVGEHDFSSFCRRAPHQTHLVRRVLRLATRRRAGGLVEVDVDGQAFCHQMVRSIVGVLVMVGTGQRPAGWVAEVLAARDRQAAGAVAPPHGLTLLDVRY